MSLGNNSVTANGIILIRHPDDEDDVERRRGVVEKFRHDRLHACNN